MGVSISINAKNEDEFNQQMQLYLAQGYRMQSNFNGTAILNKKSYSTGLLVVLILLFFPAAIIYYLVASDDVVTIRMSNGQSSASNNFSSGTATKSFDLYCEDCGHGLYNDSKFCPGCGKDLSVGDVSSEVPKCKKCGAKVSDEDRFCPNCGNDLTKIDDVPAEKTSEESVVVDDVPAGSSSDDSLVVDDVPAEKTSEESVVAADEVSKCQDCGAELSEENKFCPECGAKITDDE
ncbi:zinc ribbon domain-containing protein [uncultured Methanobrevibacter sp.]|uniref:zinc ribbon domain-containing protein n=1 Tax=uncultured Methanobrevibacter sp. TaxID=253161 RepID=UPI0025D1FF1B|nr:zinc-ribbon domain-containing protein [uncultured Methanobrevibacter sp.]